MPAESTSITTRGSPQSHESRLPRRRFTFVTKNWWLIGLRGGWAAAFVLLASVVWPGGSDEDTLIALVCTFLILDGLLALGASWRARREAQPWWPLTLEGLLGISFGANALLWPGLGASDGYVVFALWAMLGGCLQLLEAARMKSVNADWVASLAAATSLVGGLLLFMLRDVEITAHALVIGIGVALASLHFILARKLVRRSGGGVRFSETG